MITGPVLVLNRAFVPVHITSVKRAICLVFRGLARIIDQEYELHNFQSWAQVSANYPFHDTIQLTNGLVKVPRVIILTFYDRLPERRVRFSRANIFLRDRNTCQYCLKHFKRQELNIDHVIPLSQGGGTHWQNVVCSCIACNSKKGGRTPEQARMRLQQLPKRPHYSLFMNILPSAGLFAVWKDYMNPIDFSYWNMELLSSP